jgi:hypothetical protein
MSISYAQKLWGHGRVRQLLTRLSCRFVDHRWSTGTEDDGVFIQRCLRGVWCRADRASLESQAMSVYVDEMRDNGQSATWRYTSRCHMIADSLEELNAMADAIGLKREWFQSSVLPHYDLTASKRRMAVQHGAIPISWRELVFRVLAHRRAAALARVERER